MIFRTLFRGTWNILLHLIYRFDVKGIENIPNDGAAILCSNHIHWADSIAEVIFIKRIYYTMVKAELMETKIKNWFFRNLACFPVERGKGDTKAIAIAEEHLRNGDMLMMFPEGTRNGMEKGLKMKKGAAMIALQTKSPIIPIGISGTFKFMSKIKIRIGKPMDLSKYFEMEQTGAREWIEVTNMMKDEIIKLRDGE